MRVYPGKLQVSEPFCTIQVTNDTTVKDLIRLALDKFGLNDYQCEDYRCSEILLDRGGKNHHIIFSQIPGFIIYYLFFI